MNSKQTSRPWLRPALFAAGALVFALLLWRIFLKPADSTSSKVAAAPIPSNADVSASGRIEPVEPVTHIGAPYINGHPGRVAEMKVSEGEAISAGQLIAVLEGRDELEAAVRQAQARVALDEAKLEQIKAPARAADVAAQKAEVERCQLALANAQAEFHRYETLQKNHDVSVSDLDSKRTEMESARQLQEEARARLAGLTDVRPVDVRLAESELQIARAELDRARLELNDTEVRSPAAGVVLHIHAHPGEEVGEQGLLELAKTSAMCVIAEVYETDIRRVQLGEQAEIVTPLLPGQTLHGTVSVIGLEIGRADLVPTDPAAFADSRVVLVKIRLPESRPVAALIHGKVTVVIHS